ncbi:MAG: hypothetical protein GC151_18870 [Betaproteobacteria bacterium]|nr:hypothetical protein [Betaproteobacteria bacterium]
MPDQNKSRSRSIPAADAAGAVSVTGDVLAPKFGDLFVDCRWFRADRPCAPNLEHGNVCGSCNRYEAQSGLVLIVKLGAAGDIIRTSTVLPGLRRRHAGARLVWICDAEHREAASMLEGVDEILSYDAEGILRATTLEWDCVVNLSNDVRSATLAGACRARRHDGFTLDERGRLLALNEWARYWLTLASFNAAKQANRLSFQEIMYRILALDGTIERPALRVEDRERRSVGEWVSAQGARDVLVGINVGSGARWPKKMLASGQIAELCTLMLRARPGMCIVLLGGPMETGKVAAIRQIVNDARVVAWETGSSLGRFAAMIDACDLLVTGDTLALHVACATDTPTMLVMGPTSAAELHDYDGLVTKIAVPDLECLTCYSDCDKPRTCMSALSMTALAGMAIGRLGETVPAVDRQ